MSIISNGGPFNHSYIQEVSPTTNISHFFIFILEYSTPLKSMNRIVNFYNACR